MSTQSPIERKAISIARFCAEYDVGRTTAFHLMKSGKIVARHLSARKVLIDAQSAEAWYASLPTGTAKEAAA